MEQEPQQRSVKISDDERGGWSSDRPRREGSKERPPDVSVRCQVMAPSDAVRYSPGSMLVIVSASAEARSKFAERLISDRGSLLSLGRVRALLAGRLSDEEIEAKAPELLDAAALKRLAAGETVVVVAEGLEPGERERYVRLAARHRRPRHLILLEAGKDEVGDEERGALNDLRRRLDSGALGEEGFHTALRLGGAAIRELKQIAFREAPRED